MSGSKRLAIALFILAIAVPAILGMVVVPAFATPGVTVGLSASAGGGHYGDEIVLTPSVTGRITLPASIDNSMTPDVFTVYSWSLDSEDSTWKWIQFGEQLRVEDTATIDPMSIFVNEELVPYPAKLCLTYTWTDANKVATTEATSNVITLNAYRFKSTRLVLSGARSIRRNRNATVYGTVMPNCGVGNVSVRVYKGGKIVYRETVQTDDAGEAAFMHRFAKRGVYRIKMRWTGNSFGPANKNQWVSRTLVVR